MAACPSQPRPVFWSSVQWGELYAGRFVPLERVGSGTMGTVYKALDHQTQTEVALKVVRHVELRERFVREARVMAKLEHRNIVRYVGHGVEPTTGDPWLAIEWLKGEDLAARLERGRLEIADTMALASGVAQALAWAHGRGFVHRDIHPGNLFLPGGAFGSVKVLDFGLARLVANRGELTETGMIMGPLEYLPPEQIHDAASVDARADIFSFGAVLFHCLTGRPAYRGASPMEILTGLIAGQAPLVRELRPETPEPLARLVDTMISKDPLARPANGAEVLAALGRISVIPSWDHLATVPLGVEVTLLQPHSLGFAGSRASRRQQSAPAQGEVERPSGGEGLSIRSVEGRGKRDEEGLPKLPMLWNTPGVTRFFLIASMAIARVLLSALLLMLWIHTVQLVLSR